MAIYDNIEALESSPPDTATDPSGAESELYEWNDKRHTLAIQNDKSSGVDMYIKINDTTAARNDYDFLREPGQAITIRAAPEIVIKRVAIFFSGAATRGDDFQINAW